MNAIFPYIANATNIADPQQWIKHGGIMGLVICSLVFIIIQFIHHLHKKDKTFIDSLEKRDQFFVDSIKEQRQDSRLYIDKLVESCGVDRQADRQAREDDRKSNLDIHDRLAKAIDNLTRELERKK